MTEAYEAGPIEIAAELTFPEPVARDSGELTQVLRYLDANGYRVIESKGNGSVEGLRVARDVKLQLPNCESFGIFIEASKALDAEKQKVERELRIHGHTRIEE